MIIVIAMEITDISAAKISTGSLGVGLSAELNRNAVEQFAVE